MTANLEAALAYAARGWAIFPVTPRGKLPLIASAHPLGDPARGCRGECGRDGHGLHDATLDVDRLQRWWKAAPRANIGIRTGAASRLFVLDIDVKKADGKASLRRLEARHDGLPPTLEARTASGGRHFYFAFPGVELRNSAGRLGEGIDTRCDGGYVVAPPSVIREGSYTWVDPQAPLAAMPVWLVDKLRKPAPAAPVAVPRRLALNIASRVLRERAEAVMDAGEGQRNHTLNRSAFVCGQFVAAGVLNESEVEAVLIEAARRAGLGDAEIVATVGSGLSAGRAHPRQVPA